jgi:hypothetical protein
MHPNYYKDLIHYGNDKVLFNLLELMNNTHTLLHLHGNNGCARHSIENITVPNVFEITLVRNDSLDNINFQWPLNKTVIPSPIDMPNIPSNPEIVIDYPPFCNRYKSEQKSASLLIQSENNSMDNLQDKSITVITCYYKIKSKHSFKEYALWIRNLLNNINANLVIFTSADQEQWIKSIIFGILDNDANHANNANDANDYENTKIIPNVKIIIRELEDLEIVKKYNNIWDEQYRKDPTSNIRTKECYMIWNSKMSLVKEIIDLNPFNSDKFVWNDIGSMRDNRYIKQYYNTFMNYPLYQNVSTDKIDIIIIKEFEDPNQIIFQNESHLSGAIFGGGREVFLKLIDLFYRNFDMYIENNYFIGCDQQILATCYQQAPELFNLVIPDYSNQSIIDKWFYLYHYYSLPSPHTPAS